MRKMVAASIIAVGLGMLGVSGAGTASAFSIENDCNVWVPAGVPGEVHFDCGVYGSWIEHI